MVRQLQATAGLSHPFSVTGSMAAMGTAHLFGHR